MAIIYHIRYFPGFGHPPLGFFAVSDLAISSSNVPSILTGFSRLAGFFLGLFFLAGMAGL